jgi:hypothetical protein
MGKLILKSRAKELEEESIKFYSDKIINSKLYYNDGFFRFVIYDIPDNVFTKLSNTVKLKYIENRINYKLLLSDKEFNFATDILKLKYIELGWNLSDSQFNLLSDDLKLKYVNYKIEKGFILSENQFDFTPYNLKLKYIENKIIFDRFKNVSFKLKLKYIESTPFLTFKEKKWFKEHITLIFSVNY